MTNPDEPASITRAQAREAAVKVRSIHAKLRVHLVAEHPVLEDLVAVANVLGYPILMVRPDQKADEPALNMKGPIESA